jgi:hypothetical protein
MIERVNKWTLARDCELSDDKGLCVLVHYLHLMQYLTVKKNSNIAYLQN